jgi:hypothetical protein
MVKARSVSLESCAHTGDVSRTMKYRLTIATALVGRLTRTDDVDGGRRYRDPPFMRDLESLIAGLFPQRNQLCLLVSAQGGSWPRFGRNQRKHGRLAFSRRFQNAARFKAEKFFSCDLKCTGETIDVSAHDQML